MAASITYIPPTRDSCRDTACSPSRRPPGISAGQDSRAGARDERTRIRRAILGVMHVHARHAHWSAGAEGASLSAGALVVAAEGLVGQDALIAGGDAVVKGAGFRGSWRSGGELFEDRDGGEGGGVGHGGLKLGFYFVHSGGVGMEGAEADAEGPGGDLGAGARDDEGFICEALSGFFGEIRNALVIGIRREYNVCGYYLALSILSAAEPLNQLLRSFVNNWLQPSDACSRE
ncbi:MAG: hypothetical protein LQ340_006811 [Diploschistes diacapsis]|nr:MAG: hypothetical protein LQ340_006811 [Diploschistes diacapsis]